MPHKVELRHPVTGATTTVTDGSARVLAKTGWVPVDSGPTLPPKSGAGSGRDAWVAYAEANGVAIAPDASRDVVIAAVEAHAHADVQPAPVQSPGDGATTQQES